MFVKLGLEIDQQFIRLLLSKNITNPILEHIKQTTDA